MGLTICMTRHVSLKLSSLREALLVTHLGRSVTVFPLTNVASMLAQSSQVLDLNMILEILLSSTDFPTDNTSAKLPFTVMLDQFLVFWNREWIVRGFRFHGIDRHFGG